MKKKLFSLFLILIIPICLLFSGCGTEKSPSYESNTGRFLLVYSQEKDSDKIDILVDTKTRVMYLWSRHGYSGGLTIMVDSNGNPMIWEGEL